MTEATTITTHLPAIRKPGALTPLPEGKLIPSLIAGAGEEAAWRYVDFFTANIRNPNTRHAYARACVGFFLHGNRYPILISFSSCILRTMTSFKVAVWVDSSRFNSASR